MKAESTEDLLLKIDALENRLAESEQLIEAIKAGEVDAFAIKSNDQAEVYTLQSGDYAYRLLIEEFGEGALNITEEGLIVYTNNYFCELMNLSYEKVVGSSIFEYIDKDSAASFEALLKDASDGKSKGEINLTYNNKIIPVYISLASLKPKLDTIGIVISDQTEKKENEKVILKYQRELEEQNTKLLQTNEELASFTYIASHDLKEPLRKIKTFTNLILDREHKGLSPKANEHFQHIISSSTQMQDILNALMAYSETTFTESAFVDTDLNKIVAEVKENLSDELKEKNAIIESVSLPVLNVIPIRFNQLMTNLIENSIKYSNKQLQPHVKISAAIVSSGEIETAEAPADKKYWKINVDDNGIGFDQKYEHKIFEPFQRLHGKTEFKGTGIGLAICKKIAQQHHGFIKATGTPGVGATFSLFLPCEK